VLVIAWVSLFLAAVIEFMDEGRKIRKMLMYKEGWRPCRRSASKEKKALDEESTTGTRETSRGKRTPQ